MFSIIRESDVNVAIPMEDAISELSYIRNIESLNIDI